MLSKTNISLSIITPCFNEQENVSILANQLRTKALINYPNYEIIFINDGSTDGTLNELKKLNKENKKVKYISLARNFGHQNAIKAGLDHANGDAVIMMDADLQHPPEIIEQLIIEWQKGFDIVYTQRKDGQELGFIKKITAKYFYKFMNYFSDLNIEQNTADFRLLDRKVVNVAKKLKENDLFWRGLVFWFGFKKTKIDYKANQRIHGNTKYPLAKMISFAINGITSFSIKPLRFAIFLGMGISVLAAIYGLYALLLYLLTNEPIQGWTSILLSVLFIGGIQLLILGVIGEYLGKLFMQSKNRPNYIIDESTLSSNEHER